MIAIPAATVTIMRGAPGSGKTTWVENNIKGLKLVCRASDFYEDGTPNDVTLKASHVACSRLFLEALAHSLPIERLVVDNVNATLESVAFYLTAAEAYGRAVNIVRCTASLETSLAGCRQDISHQTVERMWTQLKKSDVHWPKYWPRQTIHRWKAPDAPGIQSGPSLDTPESEDQHD